MKLDYRFIQLPLKFDANRLLEEISALGESAWQPHHQGFAGNYAVTLITPHGENNSDALTGPMQPTDYLKSCPYLMEVLRCIGGVWGRTRLMKLSGQSEVTKHIDVDYYWRDRMRVHVPIITQPNVRFYCGDQDINMKAGECWIFDTWSLHNVINHATEERIHLVADTVGGEQFWKWLSNSRPYGKYIPNWQATTYDVLSQELPALHLESQNQPDVMTPWEMREYFSFIFNEAVPHSDLQAAAALTFEFCRSWHLLWVEYGSSELAYPLYAQLRSKYVGVIQNFSHLKLRNSASLYIAITNGITGHCLRDSQAKFEELRLTGYVAAANKQTNTDNKIERPLIIVCAPRSGSTMLYEALEKNTDISSIGGESHALLETISTLHPDAQNYDSNVLVAEHCSPEVYQELHARFSQNATKPNGAKPNAGEPIRLLEKTPKNALRIQFIKQLFPDTQFIYLYREPKHVISSMIDAWQSERYVTYRKLPGWQGKPWSLLLIPGWRELIGMPLHHIVAHQWATATRIMLDDLAALDQRQIIKVRYEKLLDNTNQELNKVCDFAGVSHFESPQKMAISKHTLTKPDPDKWKRNEKLIDEIWPIIEEQVLRAEAYM